MAENQMQQLLEQIQGQNQQLQAILMQKQALTMQKKEIGGALESIKTSSDDIYKSVGPVLIKTEKGKIQKDLAEQGEEIDLKLGALERQEKKLKEKIKEAQERFQAVHAGHTKQAGQGG